MILGYIGSIVILAFGGYQIVRSLLNQKAGKQSKRIVGIIEGTLGAVIVYIMVLLMITSLYLDNTATSTTSDNIETTVTQLEPLKLKESPDPEYTRTQPIYVQLASSRRDRGGFYIVATQEDGEKHKLPIPETQIFFRPEGSLLEIHQYRVKDTLLARLLGVSNKVARVTYTVYISDESIDLITNPDASLVDPYQVFSK